MAEQDRAGWQAVLIGVSRYTDSRLHDIPAARTNVEDMARALTAPGSAFAEEYCQVLTDPGQPTQIGRTLTTAARDARDVLLVYYTGHGVVAQGGRLYLALPDTDDNHPEWSSVPFATLRDTLAHSRARTRVLILDCCYSGRAFEAMSSSAAVIDGQIDIQGTYTITSSSRNETSEAPEGHRHTAFTGALLRAAADTGLTLDELFWRADDILHRSGRPRPQRRSVNIAGELRLFSAPVRRPTPETIASEPGTAADSRALFEHGLHCSDQGDAAQAESAWRRAAAQGHPGAMNNLANLLVTRKQLRDAQDWYRKAAELGNAEATGNLANLLNETQFVEEAELYYRRAAEAGNTDAMYNLAVMLDRAFHFDDAITWYRHAAEADHRDAMHNLAIRLRYRGQATEADTWWRRAGHTRAQRTGDKPRGHIPHTWCR
ncbi:caspase, EACC1-associated type [Nocardia grenadensis]